MSKLKLYILHIFCLTMLISCVLLTNIQPALATIDEDNYEGNIFMLYAGNGSLVPAQATLAEALANHKPAMLAFYVDDSRDCKKFAIVISRIQSYYGKSAEIIPVDVDRIQLESKNSPSQPSYYYSGGVPQVVVFNQSGDVILNKKGQVPFEEIDDKFREVFDLLPRSESVELRRRSFNEFSSELAE
ncbi:MAG: thioredoxin family protein [Richelia sp. RM2_1_2]|nr:thioredoxin family protein [Richelia sp. SM1_7_0]NJN11747.1 thioredoxin family protein [Richelia sp. RM1_1_1]NJO30250.1 thioredoxin family protein [Richelia sp. SL_2_1]NJO58319.1 thioredoxin family protein [Richelia sp. RM2_1_2]